MGDTPRPDAPQGLPLARSPEPARRSLVPWIAGGAVAIVAVVAAVLLLVRGEQEPRTYQGQGYTFDYPGQWQQLTGLESRGAVGQPTSHVALGIDATNLVIVETFRLNVEVTGANLQELEVELDGIVRGLAQAAEGQILNGPTPVTVAGMAAYRYQITAHTPQGMLVESRLVYAFQGATEYAINCQHTPEHAAEIEVACDQIMESFRVSGS